MRHAAFAQALLDPTLPTPRGLTDPAGDIANRRFDVYRNNVVASLSDALETGFPVVSRLVGDAFFRAMAGVYLREHPPVSPVLNRYGTDMPDFLATFAPVSHLPYLPDVARLELALRRAYHATDPPAFDPTELAAVPPDRLVSARLECAAATQVIASKYPLHAIWLANTTTGAPKPAGGAQTVLITRPDFDPCADPLSLAAGDFLAALLTGMTLAAALESARHTDAHFDPTSTLALLVRRKAICGLTESDLP